MEKQYLILAVDLTGDIHVLKTRRGRFLFDKRSLKRRLDRSVGFILEKEVQIFEVGKKLKFRFDRERNRNVVVE